DTTRRRAAGARRPAQTFDRYAGSGRNGLVTCRRSGCARLGGRGGSAMAGFVKADMRAGLRAAFTNAAETQIDLQPTRPGPGPEPGAPEAAPVVLAVVRFTG